MAETLADIEDKLPTDPKLRAAKLLEMVKSGEIDAIEHAMLSGLPATLGGTPLQAKLRAASKDTKS